MALTWLGNHIWESEGDLTTSLKILHALVKPSSISGEAQEIHRTVLYITARPLEDELKDARSRHPSRTDIKPILDVLDSHHSFQRTGSAHHTELEGWAANPGGGGIVASIRSTFSSLVLWSTESEISMTPSSYTHRQILAGIRLLGSTRVLGGLIDELKLQTESESADLALDIAATLICAPMPESFAVEQAPYHPLDPSKDALPRCPILTLRAALALQRESLSSLLERDPLQAQLIVRLHRRVEVLSAPPPIAQEVSGLDVGNIMQDINLEGVGGDEQMGMGDAGDQSGRTGEGEAEPGNIHEMLDAAAAVARTEDRAALNRGMVGMDTTGLGMDTSLDDVLNVADIGVANPEFLDLDMEGMFG
jgi:mediator of RNA polymerase II transcription subunit 5